MRKKLKPTNDLCESLNDYLSGAIPNMHQMTRSNMIQVKKNKTIKWIHDLPSTEQDKVVKLAVRRRAKVFKESKEEDLRNGNQRREKLKQAHIRRQALQKRARQEREELLTLQVSNPWRTHTAIAAAPISGYNRSWFHASDFVQALVSWL